MGLPDQGDMPPPMPEMLPEGESIPADAHRLIIGPATHWVVLKDGGIIFQRGDEIVHADGEETTNLGSHGNLIDAMQIQDTTLVLTTDGLYAIGEPVTLSPIGDALDGIVLGWLQMEIRGGLLGIIGFIDGPTARFGLSIPASKSTGMWRLPGPVVTRVIPSFGWALTQRSSHSEKPKWWAPGSSIWTTTSSG